MRQYHALKQQVPQALLMFRLGDFYELFYDDAVTAARELEITLTSRSKDKGQANPDVRRAAPFVRRIHRAADSDAAIVSRCASRWRTRASRRNS